MHRLMGRLAATVLLALFVTIATAQAPATEGSGSDVALRGVMIPTGFADGRYSAMIQIAVDGSPLADATWDLDVSFRQGGSTEDFSGRVVAGDPGTPVVLEAQLELEPGAYSLTLVAKETTAGQSGTRKLEGRWPDPATERATISPIVLLQPVQGAFMRNESTRGQGALALGDGDPAQVQLPTAAVSVVCRGPGLPGAARVERKLEGSTSVAFDPIDLPPGQEQCAQVRDIIPAGALGEGHFSYELKVMTDTGQVAWGKREFDGVRGKQGGRPGS